LALAGVNAGRIGEHDLIVVTTENTVDAMPGSLWLARGDAHLLANQMIHQRGLAHVGPPDDGHQAATGVAHEVCSSQLSACSAACCSARRRLSPTATKRCPTSGTVHATSKV